MNIGNSGTLGRWVTARHMALAGYITKIIMIETGLTYKQVRRLYQDLERDGYTLERKSRTFRGGATLIHSHTSKIQASLLMQLYFNIGGEAVLRSVNIKALNKAFRMYHAIRKEVPGMKGARWAPFDITDGLAPIFPYTFYHLTHDWFVAADIPVANDTPVHYADAIRCNVRRPPQGSLPLLTRRVSA